MTDCGARVGDDHKTLCRCGEAIQWDVELAHYTTRFPYYVGGKWVGRCSETGRVNIAVNIPHPVTGR